MITSPFLKGTSDTEGGTIAVHCARCGAPLPRGQRTMAKSPDYKLGMAVLLICYGCRRRTDVILPSVVNKG